MDWGTQCNTRCHPSQSTRLSPATHGRGRRVRKRGSSTSPPGRICGAAGKFHLHYCVSIPDVTLDVDESDVSILGVEEWTFCGPSAGSESLRIRRRRCGNIHASIYTILAIFSTPYLTLWWCSTCLWPLPPGTIRRSSLSTPFWVKSYLYRTSRSIQCCHWPEY